MSKRRKELGNKSITRRRSWTNWQLNYKHRNTRLKQDRRMCLREANGWRQIREANPWLFGRTLERNKREKKKRSRRRSVIKSEPTLNLSPSTRSVQRQHRQESQLSIQTQAPAMYRSLHLRSNRVMSHDLLHWPNMPQIRTFASTCNKVDPTE